VPADTGGPSPTTRRNDGRASADEPRRAPGTIPFLLRVGIVGHGCADDPDVLRALTAATIAEIRRAWEPPPGTSWALCAVSTLAQRADRIVARAILESADGLLQVGLSRPVAEALTGEDGENRRDLEALLARAAVVRDALEAGNGPGSPGAARAWVVGHSDVVIDLDPQPTTVDTEKTNGGFRFTGPPGERTRAAMRELDDYNRASRHVTELTGAGFERLFAQEAKGLPPGIPDDVVRWILPYFVRADRVAVRFERQFNRFVAGEFLLAAFAVFIAGFATVFTARHPRLVLLELLALASVVALVAVGRWSRTHERWLAARFLAERFRSALFLKLAGLSMRRGRGFEGVRLGDHSEEWIRRAYSYVWYTGPAIPDDPAPDDLRRMLAEGWIRPQIEYHRHRSAASAARYRLVTGASLGVFVLTAMAVVLAGFGVNGGTSRYLVLASIALPAFGSALVGIATHRQYQRHAAIYRRTAQYLASVLERIESEPTLRGLRHWAAEADEIMSDESRDWLGVMRFHDFDIAR
jgi:hypothetical protein